MNNSLEKQKYTSCELIEHGIMFDHCNVVRVCSIVNREYNGKPVIFHNYHGELFDKEKLFEMFYTVKHEVIDGRRGLGLGLALCKAIIVAHGGNIAVKDNIPHGTIFSFTLPIKEVEIHE